MLFEAHHIRSGECIAKEIEIAKTFFDRLVGLLGRFTIDANYGLFFPGCRSIHTIFMKFSLDIIFLDKNMRITKMISKMPPNRVAYGLFDTKNTLELLGGTLNNYVLKVGDQIALVERKSEDHDTK